ncbi:MAG TPA: alpha/beta fold hydrolase [Gaiellaceae bacterium]|nr:alpha/beta fold hydrolase [Gaiellaceae bacterium]
MPSFRSSGARLAYEDVGTGAPVVLLHGFTSSFERNWRERGWVEPLAGAGFRVLGLDARGHGASEKRHKPEWYDSPLLAADVVALLDRLGRARRGRGRGSRHRSAARPSRARASCARRSS